MDFAGPADFHDRVVARCEPAIIHGLATDWAAAAAARRSDGELLAYLGKLASPQLLEAFHAPDSVEGRYAYSDDLAGFNFERTQLSVPAVLARIAARAEAGTGNSWYAGSLQTEDYFPSFSAENRNAVLPERIPPRLWIGNAARVACHYDTFDNLACVIAGNRRFTLYPPAAIGGLYVGPIDHTMAGQPISLADGSGPDDPRYPDFERIRDQAVTIDLEPGTALYLPKLWWHRVESTAPINVMANWWWDAFAQGPDAPMTAMMLAMIAIAERPAPERAAWQAWFEHYVFRPQGHPLAHLPAERHGILGPLASGNYGRIRSHVMRMLRGG